MCRRWRAAMLAIGVMLAALAGTAPAQPQAVTIGAVDAVGNDSPIGATMCRILNATRKDHGIRCRVERTEGSVANIDGVMAGTLDGGFAQGDAQYDAFHGKDLYAGRPQPKLRALFTLHTESLTLVARRDAGIRTFADIRGKRVSIGSRGSGTRLTMDRAMAAFGVAPDDLKRVAELRYVDLPAALCDGRLDAFAFVGGQPNLLGIDAANACPVSIAAIAGPPVDALLAAHPYYVRTEIPAGAYKGTPAAQPSFGTPIALVVSADMPEATAYAITRAALEHFDEFRLRHPTLAPLTPQSVARDTIIPMHAGAVRYFKEAGLR